MPTFFQQATYIALPVIGFLAFVSGVMLLIRHYPTFCRAPGPRQIIPAMLKGSRLEGEDDFLLVCMVFFSTLMGLIGMCIRVPLWSEPTHLLYLLLSGVAALMFHLYVFRRLPVRNRDEAERRSLTVAHMAATQDYARRGESPPIEVIPRHERR